MPWEGVSNDSRPRVGPINASLNFPRYSASMLEADCNSVRFPGNIYVSLGFLWSREFRRSCSQFSIKANLRNPKGCAKANQLKICWVLLEKVLGDVGKVLEVLLLRRPNTFSTSHPTNHPTTVQQLFYVLERANHLRSSVKQA